MLVIVFAVCVALVILAHPKSDEDEVSPGCNAAAWVLAFVCFAVLLGVASVVGTGLALLAVQP
jgi:hypothetical protein